MKGVKPEKARPCYPEEEWQNSDTLLHVVTRRTISYKAEEKVNLKANKHLDTLDNSNMH